MCIPCNHYCCIEHFYHLIEFSPFQSVWLQTIICGSVSGLFSVPLIYMCILVPIPPCLNFCSFVESVEIRHCKYSNFVFLYQNYFGSYRIFAFYMHFHINFKVRLSVFTILKSDCQWDVHWNCTESRTQWC